MVATVQGKKIYYELEGSGAPILLVHGWGGSAASLRPLAKLLADHYRTILVDLPGFGQSDNPDPDWGIGEYSRNLVAFTRSLGLTGITFIGHSLGGSLGIYVAAHHPGVVDKLILIAPSFKRNARHKPTFAHHVLRRFFGCIPLAKVLYYKMFYPSSDLLKYPRLESNFRKIVTQDLTADTLKIETPTLVLWGATDTYVQPQDARLLHKNIKGSELRMFEDKGHGLPLFHPEVVTKEIEKFLNRS